MRKVLFILGQLTDSDVDWLAVNGTRKKLSKGDVLIRHGTRPLAMYIVLDGEMGVVTAKGMRLAGVASGDILGEMSFLDSSPTVVSVVAEQDCRVLEIPKPILESKLETDVAFAARFYKALGVFLTDRMRGTINKFGYGAEDEGGERMEADELDIEVLDKVHLAGARFERMLKKLAG
ncbi:MAG: cyclic nucleotide-binding domain-containing protein [Betaproteobacteria bacterium]